MNQANQYIQEEPQLQLADLREPYVAKERYRIVDDLHLDSHGRMEPIRQGKQLLSEIEKRLQGPSIRQADVRSATELLAAGERTQTDFEEFVLTIASDTNGAALLPGLKDGDRLHQKVNDEYNGDASAIFDVVRGSIVFDSLEDLYNAVKEVYGRVEIVRVEDRFAHPLRSGYRDLKLNIRIFDEQGRPHITELQFHLQGMLDAKKWETPLYIERRDLEEKLKQMRVQAEDPLKIKELEERVARLQYDAQSVYGKVWERYTKGIDWN